MDSTFERNLRAFIAASDGRITITSGDRDTATQTRLWEEAVARYGPEEARWWVAPPGNSNHEKGLAADLEFASTEARQWAHENAARFGLWFPLSNEEWHIEPAGSRSGPVSSGAPRSGYQEVESPPVLGTRPDPFAGLMERLGIATSTLTGGSGALDLLPSLALLTGAPDQPAQPAGATAAAAQPALRSEGGFEDWLAEVARIKGLTPEEIEAFRQLGMAESGGRNIWQEVDDINMQNGDPAFGPWQVIGSTFNAHKEPGYDDRFDPVASGLASVNYMRSRYGRILSKAGY